MSFVRSDKKNKSHTRGGVGSFFHMFIERVNLQITAYKAPQTQHKLGQHPLTVWFEMKRMLKSIINITSFLYCNSVDEKRRATSHRHCGKSPYCQSIWLLTVYNRNMLEVSNLISIYYICSTRLIISYLILTCFLVMRKEQNIPGAVRHHCYLLCHCPTH